MVRRGRRSKIATLEQQRRGLIVALVKIDQEIDKERTIQVAAQAPPSLFRGDVAEEVFGADGDLDPGD